MRNFLAGLGAGIGLGLMVAPQSGPQTRRQLKRSTKSFAKAVQQKSEEVQEALRDPKSILDATREKGRELANNVRGSVGAEDSDHLLNTVDREQLIAVYGIGPVLADRIIENRPYRSARELVERGIIPESTFAELRRELPNMRRDS